MLDLNLYQYFPSSDIENQVMPGLYTGLPPRKAARGREGDRLVLYLSLTGGSTLTPETQRDILEKLTTVFYNTRGTVTVALKTIVSQLNDRLLARNLRGGRETSTVTGLFQALVLHGNTVLLAQSGPTHSILLNQDGLQHWFDPEGAGQGLGTSRAGMLRFYRADLIPGDRIIFCANPPGHWKLKSLSDGSTQSLEVLSQYLVQPSALPLRFLLIQVDRGKGQINLLNLRKDVLDPAQSLTPAQPVQAEENPVPPTEEPNAVYISGDPLEPQKSETPTTISDSGEKVAGLFASLLAGRKEKEAASERVDPVQDAVAEPDSQAAPIQEAGIPFTPETYTPSEISEGEPWTPTTGEPDFSIKEPPVSTGVTPSSQQRKVSSRKTRAAVAGGLRGWQAFKQRTAGGLSKILARIIPGQAEKLPGISPAALIFIAVAVPLIIVAAATTVYFQNGRGEQHQVFLAQSVEAFTQGKAQTDAVLQRVNYEAALDWVKKAEEYGITDESQALHIQIGNAIDSMDGISRFELKHALPADFDRGVRITQIWAAQTEDLYLLDGANGRVLRMVYTRPGYEVDSQFSCGPGMIGSLIIGPLVDIVLAPSGNSFGAVVIGVDGTGNLLYCSLDSTKTTAMTLPPPDAGWGNIQAIAYQNSVLSILDIGSNAVWRFEGFGLDFSNKPRLFFDNQVPNLATAVDLVVYLDDLFVLNQDGHMLLCTYSYIEITPTRCTDPYPYRISVAGQAPVEQISLNAQFTQLQATQPPEPSMYFLDVSGRSIQQFSMSLNFVRRLQPKSDGEDALPDVAPSAFAVTNGRNLVVAYDNQVFIAPLPAP